MDDDSDDEDDENKCHMHGNVSLSSDFWTQSDLS